MTFWQHFFCLVGRKPIPALAALYWHLTRRRVRARNRLRVASADLLSAYALWIDANEQICELGNGQRTAADGHSSGPHFAVFVHSATGPAEKRRSIASVKRQIYSNWSLVERIECAAPSDFSSGNKNFIILLRSGDLLSETALLHFAEALQSNGGAAILYGDEDHVDGRGRRSRPWFKPRWNEEMFLAQDYLSSAVAIEANLTKEVVGRSGDDVSAMVLDASSTTEGRIIHIPHILSHVSERVAHQTVRIGAVARHVQSRGAKCVSGPFGTVKVEWPLPDELPLVSIIIPTKDKLELLRPCVQSVLSQTNYAKFEVLIVDNGSVEQSTKEYLAEAALDTRVTVLPYPKPYNFSAINNFAAREASGAFLCLLNNDTVVIEPYWLTEMMRYAVRPEIAAVGAKLLYDDGSIQHAGVVVGIGEAAGHAHRFLPANDPGYFYMPHVAQFVTAVTAACLVVEKNKFEAVGGLDEKKLAVAFNDVDLCLKLQSAGWRNVYVPHAVLLHHESKSRGNDMSPVNIDRYMGELATIQERWGTKTYEDPQHNPNLDRYSETFVFRL